MRKNAVNSALYTVIMICLSFGIVRAEPLTPEAAYKRVQGYSAQKQWGMVYDSYDKESQEILDAVNQYFFESEKLSPRERYIEIFTKYKEEAADANSKGEVVSTEIKGDRALLSIKYPDQGYQPTIIMRLEQGEWKLHISEDSQEYKIAQEIRAKKNKK